MHNLNSMCMCSGMNVSLNVSLNLNCAALNAVENIGRIFRKKGSMMMNHSGIICNKDYGFMLLGT